MDDSGGPHHRSPSLSPPPPDAGKRRRIPNVRLAGSIPLPSHLPHPRRVPISPASRSRKPQHHNGGSNSPASEPPQALPKPWSPASADDGDDLVLAAALPRKPRVPEAETESQGEEAGEVVDVAEWLWGMGMGRYVPAFEAHEVDAEVLPCLTMDDLRDMGIGAVGARRKLFCAIQRLPPPRREWYYYHSLCRHRAPNGVVDLLQCHRWWKALPSTGWKEYPNKEGTFIWNAQETKRRLLTVMITMFVK